ncbi:MAG TPA: hypothetical protein ACFYD6_09220 [Candidatus Brocadiia bacterium]
MENFNPPKVNKRVRIQEYVRRIISYIIRADVANVFLIATLT